MGFIESLSGWQLGLLIFLAYAIIVHGVLFYLAHNAPHEDELWP